ncbi:hypothetical protein Ccrd_024224 [Cynara cardunculus var. scolymus]|uniref:Cupredoxin n=1 Tax=Cynara cardunculus var. scolymus TaxID=59895 RepID=A0A118JSC9_CYNCS|nr:hypothetical protein Ccrd_024224 [Cynara cardunculus var. scolymus]
MKQWGPQIDCVTNDNVIVSVVNSLDEPFLITWNGIQQRRNSWQDGVYGTNCPIPPGQNFTYILQVKDQIGSFFYFPSLAFHKAAGGFGGITISSRPMIPVPFPPPAADYTILAGDWFKQNHTVSSLSLVLLLTTDSSFDAVDRNPHENFQDLKAILDGGSDLPFPDGLLINGRGSNGFTFNVDQGKTYRLRISNVGMSTSINFRIQGHKMLLVEVEGTHSLQNTYSSLDIHLGQTQNLTASGPRPNPQGSYHYGMVNFTRTIRLANSAPVINGKQRYAVNSVSFIPADTPLKIADYFKISGVFSLGSISDSPTGGGGYLQTSVMAADFRGFAEIVFENSEDTVQSWHIDGHFFFVVGMDGGQWSASSRTSYNLRDGISRSTVQVYPNSWTALYVPLDNVGMWNIRSQNWARQYLGQQFYLRVYSPVNSWRDEYPIPKNAITCGRASGRKTRPL